MKKTLVAIILSGLIAQLSFAQWRYEIISWKIMMLDKKVKPINGHGYYINETKRSGGGVILITSKEFLIKPQTRFQDPYVTDYIVKRDVDSVKTIYYTGDNSQLIFFKGTIDGGKMYQQIQYNTDFDQTLQLYAKRVVFETYRVINASEKKKDIEDKGEILLLEQNQ